MDRLDDLAAFVAVLEAGSLAAAGRKLRRSPPAMTRSLARLEESVGARLFERTTRRLTATEAGRRLAERARDVLAGYADAVREVAAAPVRGVLRVTAPVVFGRRHVTPIVASFLDAYPGVRVELVLNDRNLDLVAESLDVAVRIGRLSDSSLVVRRVGEVRRVLCASPTYLAGREAIRGPSDLARHDIVFVASRPGPLEWRFPGGGRGRVVRLEPRLVVNEVEALLIALRAGRGVGRPLSYQVADDLASGALVRLLPDHEPPPLPVQLVVPSARHLAPKTRAFLDHAARSLAALGVLHAS
ncbi:MAG TPA: LysR family transcriptional regulator [Haliangiales bacterium]|nr:LysR family transcriptional regulator [Haliangiales bacterium]